MSFFPDPCPPIATPPAGYCNGVARTADNQLWIDSARGAVHFGEARWDIIGNTSVNLNTPQLPGGVFAGWTLGTNTPLVVVNPFRCPLAVFGGIDLVVDAETNMSAAGYRIYAHAFLNGSQISGARATVGIPVMFMTPNPDGRTLRQRNRWSASANPFGVGGGANNPAAWVVLPAGGSATIEVRLGHDVDPNPAGTGPVPSDIATLASAAVRVHGYRI
jgi:hypothetical protein